MMQIRVQKEVQEKPEDGRFINCLLTSVKFYHNLVDMVSVFQRSLPRDFQGKSGGIEQDGLVVIFYGRNQSNHVGNFVQGKGNSCNALPSVWIVQPKSNLR